PPVFTRQCRPTKPALWLVRETHFSIPFISRVSAPCSSLFQALFAPLCLVTFRRLLGAIYIGRRLRNTLYIAIPPFSTPLFLPFSPICPPWPTYTLSPSPPTTGALATSTFFNGTQQYTASSLPSSPSASGSRWS